MLTQCSTAFPRACPYSVLNAIKLFKSTSNNEKAAFGFERRRVENVSRNDNKLAHPVRASIRSTNSLLINFSSSSLKSKFCSEAILCYFYHILAFIYSKKTWQNIISRLYIILSSRRYRNSPCPIHRR